MLVAELSGKNAMFQSSLSLAVLAVSYALHAKHQPFATNNTQMEAFAEQEAKSAEVSQRRKSDATARRLSRRFGQHDSEIVLQLAKGGLKRVMHDAEVLLDFNVLETVQLSCSTTVLLCGMIFHSAQLSGHGASYLILTIVVAGVITASLAFFVWMVAVETRRTCKRQDVVAARAAGTAPTDVAGALHLNPAFSLRNLAFRSSIVAFRRPSSSDAKHGGAASPGGFVGNFAQRVRNMSVHSSDPRGGASGTNAQRAPATSGGDPSAPLEVNFASVHAPQQRGDAHQWGRG